MHRDLFEYAVKSLIHRQLRSWLTILGIVIGVAAVISLIAISFGLDSEIRKQLSFFGNDMINISPGNLDKGGNSMAAQTGTLTENDLAAVRKVGGIWRAAAALQERVAMTYRNKNITLYAMGTEPMVADMYKMKVEEGRLPQEGDRGVVILGYDVAHTLFDEKIEINRRITLNGREFRVVGIFEKSGGSIMDMGSLVFIPQEDAREIMGRYKGNNVIAEIHAQVDPNAKTADVAQDVTNELLKTHKVTEDNRDFTVMTSDFIMQQVSTIMNLLTLFLGGVSGISLLVGAIGIANTMFMSVLERTKEIGTLKAIGASQEAILEVFLFESALLGLMGGLIGVAVSMLISFIINQFGFPSQVSIELVLFGIVFSVLVGAVSGFVPAQQAAKLEAIEALRYD